MTINEAIVAVQELKPSAWSETQMVGWLGEVDGKMANELQLDTVPRYVWPEDANTELLAPSPYDALYVDYLSARISLANRDMDEYTNDKVVAQVGIDDFKAWYRRGHRAPCGGGIVV